jgi:cbb3-type cytochrome oxidase maturation protein
MDILFLLVPLSVVLVFAIMAVFAWALRSGQFDDIEREGQRILDTDGLPQPDKTSVNVAPGHDVQRVDADQLGWRTRGQESRPTE